MGGSLRGRVRVIVAVLVVSGVYTPGSALPLFESLSLTVHLLNRLAQGVHLN